LVAEYDLDAQELAVLQVPFHPRVGTALVGADDGMLLYAAIVDSALYL
jgi:hypothetical protein